MSKNYKPVKGDRVRVVLEGEVNRSDSSLETGFNLQDETFYTGIDTEAPFVVSIEKIEPPVEVFKPGDVVRYKHIPDYVYAIGTRGYMDLYNAVWNSTVNIDQFTSKAYERVTLS